MKDLFAYLFGGSQVESEVEETKAVIEKIMEEAEEQEPLKVKRTPLINALKALGLKDVSGEIEYDPEGFSLVCREEFEYRHYVDILMSPDAMEKLAELGWVVTRCGDVAMTNEPAELRIRFLEITCADDDAETRTDWPAPNDKLMTGIIKKGREFMSEPAPHDDEGPVEYDDKTSDDPRKGVGKAQDGKDPEGKPKGGTGKTEAQELASQVMDEAESPKGVLKQAGKPERCPHCEGQGYTDEEGNPRSRDCQEATRCGWCKGTGKMPTGAATTYKRGVEGGVSKTLGRPWKWGEALHEARHKAGCQCGFCKNMGSFGKKKKDEPAEADAEADAETGIEEAYKDKVPYVDKTGKKRKVPWIKRGKPKTEEGIEPPRYDDMYQMLEGKGVSKQAGLPTPKGTFKRNSLAATNKSQEHKRYQAKQNRLRKRIYPK